jgi:tRNA A-37 threonylcarbamoyl transferase component Bud32
MSSSKLALKVFYDVFAQLKKGIFHPKVQGASMGRRYNRVLESVRLRSRKILRFAKNLCLEHNNAADFVIMTEDQRSIPRLLERSGHVLVTSADGSPFWREEDFEAEEHKPKGEPDEVDKEILEKLGKRSWSSESEAGREIRPERDTKRYRIYVVGSPNLRARPEILKRILLSSVSFTQNHGASSSYLPLNEKSSTPLGPHGHAGSNEAGVFDAKPTSHDAYLVLISLPAEIDFAWDGPRVPIDPHDPVETQEEEDDLEDAETTGKECVKLPPATDWGPLCCRLAYLPPLKISRNVVRLVAGDPMALERCKQDLLQVLTPERIEVSIDGKPHLYRVAIEVCNLRRAVLRLAIKIADCIPLIRDRMQPGADVELVENWFSFASDFGARVVRFLHGWTFAQAHLSRRLISVALDWVSFTCSDCIPSDRRTFRWALMALEFVSLITRGVNVMIPSGPEFTTLRNKVACCVTLIISHFGLRERAASAEAKIAQTNNPAGQIAYPAQQAQSQASSRWQGTGLTPDYAVGVDSGFRSWMYQEAGAGVSGPGDAADGAEPTATTPWTTNVPAGDAVGSGDAAKAIGHERDGLSLEDPGPDFSDDVKLREKWLNRIKEIESKRFWKLQQCRLVGKIIEREVFEERGLGFLASSSSTISIRWQMVKYIGGGAFGSVYMAINLDTGEPMAVKEVKFKDPHSLITVRKAIREEMTAVERLAHPNIVTYYGIEVHQDRVYIFMEHCGGGSLGSLLENGRIEDEMVVRVYAHQLLKGIEYLHANNIIHRDIKPDNVLLDSEGVIKLVDFGASKSLFNQQTMQDRVVEMDRLSREHAILTERLERMRKDMEQG